MIKNGLTLSKEFTENYNMSRKSFLVYGHFYKQGTIVYNRLLLFFSKSFLLIFFYNY